MVTLTANNVSNTDLTVTEVNLRRKEMEKVKAWIGTDGGIAYFNIPKIQAEERDKMIVQFRTLNVTSGKIENALANEIQDIFKEGNDVLFVTRSNRFGKVEILFKKEKNSKEICC